MCAIPRGDSLLSTQEVLSVNKNASELRLADLETQWEEDHIAILHSNQDKLHIDPEGVKRIDGYTPCAQLAYCACRQPAVGKFCQKLLAGMKKVSHDQQECALRGACFAGLWFHCSSAG